VPNAWAENAVGLATMGKHNLNNEVVITGTPARHGPAGSENLPAM